MFRKVLKPILIIVCMAAFAAFIIVGTGLNVYAASNDRLEQFRPQLTYTPLENWNNDPNGLLYAEGKYHMYYQYATTGNTWDTMHWGHATSTDLIHWQEESVAILPNMPGWNNYNPDVPSGPIFSGSAVYVSRENASRAYNGAGFYAIFTQPNQNPADGAGDQRQSIAYSADGYFYDISTYREIIPNDYDSSAAQDGSGKEARGDFRDPKVFWMDEIGKWMMVVGGGEIVQFVSDDLLNWNYIGSTGLWGECPDLFKIDDTWVLLLSPEDKTQSHEYNGTTRETHCYPNEFYVLGSVDGNGLFVREGDLEQYSFGPDSYAVQTFTDTPDGRRIAVSWAANWKNVGEYSYHEDGGIRSCWNGGMTMLTELGIEEIGGRKVLTRTVLKEYESLRGQPLFSENNMTVGEDNVLEGVNSSIFEAVIGINSDESAADSVTIKIAMSDYEETRIIYDLSEQTVTVDRCDSSLTAAQTSMYRIKYSHSLVPEDGVVTIRIFYDGANLMLEGGSGQAVGNFALFAQSCSDGFSLTSDGEATVSATVYPLASIWNNESAKFSFDDFYLSSKNANLEVGKSMTVLASSPNPSFDFSDIEYTSDNGNVILTKRADGSCEVLGAYTGTSVISVSSGGKVHRMTVTVLSGIYDSDIEFDTLYTGSWKKDSGIIGSSSGDGFLYSDYNAYNFSVSAKINSVADNSVAFGIMFGANESFYNYYCANYDYAAGIVKLWQAGGAMVASYPLKLRRGDVVDYSLTLLDGEVSIAVNGLSVIEVYIGEYAGGYLGLNVYNGTFLFDEVRLYGSFGAGETPCVPLGEGDFMIRNSSTGKYLKDSDYTVSDGLLTLNESYTSLLTGGRVYDFEITYSDGGTYCFSYKKVSSVKVIDTYRSIDGSSDLGVIVNFGTYTPTKVTIDGREVEFVYNDSTVIISKNIITELRDGDHTLAMYTQGGVAEYVFGYEFIPPEPENMTGAYLSTALWIAVAALIAGFAVYWLVASKRKV